MTKIKIESSAENGQSDVALKGQDIGEQWKIFFEELLQSVEEKEKC